MLAEFEHIRRVKAFRDAYAEAIAGKLGSADAFRYALAAADNPEVVNAEFRCIG